MRNTTRMMMMMMQRPEYMSRILSVKRDNIIGLWDFQEASGAVVTNKVTKLTASAVEAFVDGGFEIAGAGGADIYMYWEEALGNGALADETSLVHAGGSAHAAKITAGASANTYLYHDILVKPGQAITFSLWTRGDGTNSGRYLLQNAFTGATLIAVTSCGVTGTDYAQVTFSYTPAAGVNVLRLRLYCPAANGGIAYFDDVSALSISDCAGLYPAVSVTYQQPGIPGVVAVPYSAKFDGATSAVRVGSGGYDNLCNPDIGSAITWGKVKVNTVWTDTSTHRYLWHPKDAADANKYLVFGKYKDTNHTVFWRRKTGVAADQNEQTYTFATAGPTDWFCMGYSWDITVPQLRGYLYVPGVLAWTKVFDIAGTDMDTLAGSNWNGQSYLFAGGNNSQLWQGWGSIAVQWAGVTLTDTEMQRVMTA